MGARPEPSEAEILVAGKSIELLCVKGGFDVIRSRIPPNGITVIVRTGLSKVLPVPAEVFTLEVERAWVFGHTRYAKGLVTHTRLELLRLELEPLGLQEWGSWDPEEEAWPRMPSSCAGKRILSSRPSSSPMPAPSVRPRISSATYSPATCAASTPTPTWGASSYGAGGREPSIERVDTSGPASRSAASR
jgi:hypothetical protein